MCSKIKNRLAPTVFHPIGVLPTAIRSTHPALNGPAPRAAASPGAVGAAIVRPVIAIRAIIPRSIIRVIRMTHIDVKSRPSEIVPLSHYRGGNQH